jgi:hypothetical protein
MITAHTNAIAGAVSKKPIPAQKPIRMSWPVENLGAGTVDVAFVNAVLIYFLHSVLCFRRSYLPANPQYLPAADLVLESMAADLVSDSVEAEETTVRQPSFSTHQDLWMSEAPSTAAGPEAISHPHPRDRGWPAGLRPSHSTSGARRSRAP